jgi:hypothetical protein
MISAMKVAILYICTGNYNQFFEKFFESCENFFLNGMALKEYFVWTDDILLSSSPKVHIIEKRCDGFPKDSLFRFDMFLQVKNRLQYFDYIYFFNSNTEFKSLIGKEILPDNSGLVAAEWPGSYKPFKCCVFYPYERNKKSMAYIKPFNPPYKYFMGGINGGKSYDYLKMIEILAYNINYDYQRGIIARVHDESHINRYLHSRPCKILSKQYCWPEEWPSDFKPKIIFRDKVKINSYFDKGRKHSLLNKIVKGFRIIYYVLNWYI